MIVRITGILESVEGLSAFVAIGGGELVREVLIPAFLAERLAAASGQQVTLHTLEYLESPNQGASFVPRLVGFASASDRRFFDLLTTVKGIGNRKALRAMAEEPAAIARAIAARDARALTRLPEVGKRVAETIIVELAERIGPFLGDSRAAIEPRTVPRPAGAEDEAIAVLVALGETRAEAERRVRLAADRRRAEGAASGAEELVQAALAG